VAPTNDTRRLSLTVESMRNDSAEFYFTEMEESNGRIAMIKSKRCLQFETIHSETTTEKQVNTTTMFIFH